VDINATSVLRQHHQGNFIGRMRPDAVLQTTTMEYNLSADRGDHRWSTPGRKSYLGNGGRIVSYFSTGMVIQGNSSDRCHGDGALGNALDGIGIGYSTTGI